MLPSACRKSYTLAVCGLLIIDYKNIFLEYHIISQFYCLVLQNLKSVCKRIKKEINKNMQWNSSKLY